MSTEYSPVPAGSQLAACLLRADPTLFRQWQVAWQPVIGPGLLFYLYGSYRSQRAAEQRTEALEAPTTAQYVVFYDPVSVQWFYVAQQNAPF